MKLLEQVQRGPVAAPRRPVKAVKRYPSFFGQKRGFLPARVGKQIRCIITQARYPGRTQAGGRISAAQRSRP